MEVDNFIAPGFTALVISVMYALYKILKHSNCRSTCCGVRSSFEMDLTLPQLDA